MTVAATRSRTTGRHVRRAVSRWRFARLHGQARSLPWFFAGVVALVFAAWWVASWLAGIEWLGGAPARMPLVVWAPAVGALLASAGLGGADEEFERSTALPWWLVRLVHLTVVMVLLGGPLASTGLWEPQTYGAFELVRNVVGYAGITAAGAVLFGARLAWAPLIAYVTLVYATTPRPANPYTAWWTWPAQPWGPPLAGWVAAGVGIAGVALYCWRGARPSSVPE